MLRHAWCTVAHNRHTTLPALMPLSLSAGCYSHSRTLPALTLSPPHKHTHAHKHTADGVKIATVPQRDMYSKYGWPGKAVLQKAISAVLAAKKKKKTKKKK